MTLNAPLSNKEVLEVVKEVLDLNLNANLVDSIRDDARTPTSAIITTTPDAPDIPKINIDQNGGLNGRYAVFSLVVHYNIMFIHKGGFFLLNIWPSKFSYTSGSLKWPETMRNCI